MHTVTPYLRVDGAAQLIEFLQLVFLGGIIERLMNPDGTVMHAQLKIGDSTVMVSDTRGTMAPFPACLYIYLGDPGAAYARALAAGALSLREPTNEFYGDRSAGVRDSWGNEWWLATHVEDVSTEEMERRMQALRTNGNR
jgi:PhnB protein